ncbi:GntR family transcriptional regulator [Gammaproteobacteria bacterium LSUCC0057]|uniref:GntR family transcriptional regulator n=1 Tax=Gammaproteobacteria bacterium LSUCC0057 TaxID=2559237 RepID=A0A4Y8UIN8_9GAMM|nr:GntR family transcriptional regulator [Gammaproteobacteria bacterium LSUCC0057]
MHAIDDLFTTEQRRSLSADSPTPLYHQLYALLKTRILNGTFSYGDRLPTEEQLSNAFLVSRITAKRAMDELASAGLVARQRGRGTYVVYRYRANPLDVPLVGVLEEIETMAANSRAVILESALQVPPGQIRQELGLAAGQTALHLRRVRQSDGIRFGYYESWTRGVEAPDDLAELAATPRLTYFRQRGLAMTHVTQTLSAVAASEEVAEVMDMAVAAPMLQMVRRTYNRAAGGEVVDFLTIQYNPDYFQYQLDVELA